MSDKNTFESSSVKRIANAVRAVERMSSERSEPTVDYPTDTAGTFRTVIRGSFSGEWAAGSDATVSFTADNGETGTKTAHNYFATVGEAGATRNCCIVLAGSEWILIAAECG